MTADSERIDAARSMLSKLDIESSDPRWSSWVLERLVDTVANAPNGSVGDLFRALDGLLAESSCALSKPVANLIKDLVVKSFTQHRASYGSADWDWLAQRAGGHPSPAQAYVALLALPPEKLGPSSMVGILRALEPTPYWHDALNSLSEGLANGAARELLSEWLAEGIDQMHARDLERFLQPGSR